MKRKKFGYVSTEIPSISKIIPVVINNFKKYFCLIVTDSKILCLTLSWMFFAFAFTYGNALYVQDKYTDYRIELVIQDLEDLNILNEDKDIKLQILGTIPLAPSIRNMPQTYKILNRLIPTTFRGDWFWGTYKFYNYYDLKNITKSKNSGLKNKDLPILKDNIYHTIKGDDKDVIVELK